MPKVSRRANHAATPRGARSVACDWTDRDLSITLPDMLFYRSDHASSDAAGSAPRVSVLRLRCRFDRVQNDAMPKQLRRTAVVNGRVGGGCHLPAAGAMGGIRSKDRRRWGTAQSVTQEVALHRNARHAARRSMFWQAAKRLKARRRPIGAGRWGQARRRFAPLTEPNHDILTRYSDHNPRLSLSPRDGISKTVRSSPLETGYRKIRYPGVMTPRPRPTASAFRVLRPFSATTCVEPSFSAWSLVWTKRHCPRAGNALQIGHFRPKSRCLSFAATLGL